MVGGGLRGGQAWGRGGEVGGGDSVHTIWRTHGDGTGNTVMGGGEELGAPGKLPRDSRDPVGDNRHPQDDTKEAACGKAGREDQ